MQIRYEVSVPQRPVLLHIRKCLAREFVTKVMDCGDQKGCVVEPKRAFDEVNSDGVQTIGVLGGKITAGATFLATVSIETFLQGWAHGWPILLI